MAGTPRFFKVILHQTLIDKKLNIPEKFVRKFGVELSDVGTLTVPNGRVWQVGLKKDGRKIWFQDGWHDFMEYHSISVGYFLVFKYGHDSNFNILIFDATACEIQYPFSGEGSKVDKQKSIPSNEMEKEDFAERMDFASSIRPPSSLKRSSGEIHYVTPRQNEAEPSFGSGSMHTSSKQQCVNTLDNPGFRHACEMHSKTGTTEKLVEIDESNHVNVNESSQRGLLHLQRHQTRGSRNLYASSSLAQTKLEVLGNKSEPQNFGHEGGTDSTVIVHERSKFDEKELLTSLENSKIYTSERYKRFTANERERAINVARLIKSNNPSIMIVLRSCDFTGSRMYVPNKFAKEHLSRDLESINVQVPNGGEWPLIIKRWSGYYYIERGWRALAKELNVQAGDICVFELIRVKDILLKASVFYASI